MSKIGIKTLITILLLLVSGVAHGENPVGAFGQIFGSDVDPDVHQSTGKDWRGALTYQFIPDNPYPLFSLYSVTVTPVTKRIFRIGAEGTVAKGRCNIERSVLRIVLEKKYPKTKCETTHALRNVSCHFGDRFISIQCTDNESVTTEETLSITYVDILLNNSVLDERASQVDKGNF